MTDAATARDQRAERARQIAAHPHLAPHGTRSTYSNWGCRCPDCVHANTASRAAWRRTGTTVTPDKEGTDMPALRYATPLNISPALEQLTDDWRNDAACRVGGHDPNLWFADRGPDLDKAQAICAECPVRSECETDALNRGERHGVWGGYLFVAGLPVRGAA